MTGNPYIDGYGQIANTSTNEPERLTSLFEGDRRILPQAKPGAPAITGADLQNYGLPNRLSGGGPMSYSERGVGTNNPNAYAVGQNSRRPTRALERLTRQGTGAQKAQAAIALAELGTRTSEGDKNRSFAKESADAAFARDLEMYGRRTQDMTEAEKRRFDQNNQMFDKDTARRKDESAEDFKRRTEMATTQFERQKGESEAEWNRRVEEAKRQEERNKGFTVAPLDPKDASKGNAILRGDGSLFNVLPGQEASLTPEELQTYGEQFPDATITGRMGGARIMRPGAGQGAQPRIIEIPGAPIPDPLNPGGFKPGPSIPAQVNPDGTYTPLQPRKPAGAGGSADAGAGGGDAQDRLKGLRGKAGL